MPSSAFLYIITLPLHIPITICLRHNVVNESYSAAYDAARWAVSAEEEDAAVAAAKRASQMRR